MSDQDLKHDELKKALQIDRSTDIIVSELISSIKKENLLFSHEGLCHNMNLQIYPDQYFIAQEYNENRDDLRNAIEKALDAFGFKSIAADDFYLSEIVLCKIAGLIQGTPFGIYQLTKSQNRNVYLELGVSIALEKPFILVKDFDATPADCIRDVEYYPINSYLDVSYKLGPAVKKQIASIGKYQYSKTKIKKDNGHSSVLIYHSDIESVDITVVLAKALKLQGFSPVILGKFNIKLHEYLISEADVEPKFISSRDGVVGAIRSAKFCVFRTHKTASPDNFFAMGVAIGLNKPFLPIKRKTVAMPSDLGVLTPLIYSGYTDIQNKMKTQFSSWYKDQFTSET